jgi:hypothetical protein
MLTHKPFYYPAFHKSVLVFCKQTTPKRWYGAFYHVLPGLPVKSIPPTGTAREKKSTKIEILYQIVVYASVYSTVPVPQMRPKNASIEDGKRQPAHVELYAGSTNNYEVKTNSF